MGFSPAEIIAFLEHPEDARIPIQAVYEQLKNRSQKQFVVDKTPSYAKQLTTLQRVERLFYQAKYIHLVRHPYAVIDSFVRHRFHKLIPSTAKQSIFKW